MDAVRAADRRAADHHPPDPSAAFPIDRLGSDEVSAGSESHVARVCADPAVANSGDARARHCGTRFLDKQTPGDRLARLGRWRSARYNVDSAGPLAEHASTGRKLREFEATVRR